MPKRLEYLWSLIKSVSTKILICFIRFLTTLTVIFYRSYKWLSNGVRRIFNGLREVGKNNISISWLVLAMLSMMVLCGVVFYKWCESYKEIGAYIENTRKHMDVERKIRENLENQNNTLKDEIEKKNADLQAKADEQAKFAQQQKILVNRDKSEQHLPEYIKNLVDKYCDTYGVADKRLVSCIIFHESGGNTDAVGDNGAAVGVAQYHIGTFLSHRRQMGLSEEDLRTDAEASIRAMLFSISRGGIGNWTARYACM